MQGFVDDIEGLTEHNSDSRCVLYIGKAGGGSPASRRLFGRGL